MNFMKSKEEIIQRLLDLTKEVEKCITTLICV